MVYNKGKAKKAAKVKTKINSIVKKAKKIKGTKAKVKYVNKKMCQMCTYDWAAYRYNGNSSKYDDAYEAYGCLVKGKAVCSGYAEAFSAIMTELNIPVKYVSTSDHTWNKVKVGKKWLHVDITCNDCTSSTRWLLKTTRKD